MVRRRTIVIERRTLGVTAAHKHRATVIGGVIKRAIPLAPAGVQSYAHRRHNIAAPAESSVEEGP